MAEAFVGVAIGRLAPLRFCSPGGSILKHGPRRRGVGGCIITVPACTIGALARFMQTDPIGYYDAMNLYQYCGNNPTNWTDPSGLAFEGYRNLSWRDRLIRGAASAVNYSIPREKYTKGTQNVLYGVAGVSGGTAVMMGTGNPGVALLGVKSFSAGIAGMGIGGFQVINAAAEGPEEINNLPTGWGDSVGRAVGEMAGNGEKGQAIGSIVDSMIDIANAGTGLKNAKHALEVADNLVSGGAATKALIEDTVTVLGDDKPFKDNDK